MQCSFCDWAKSLREWIQIVLIAVVGTSVVCGSSSTLFSQEVSGLKVPEGFEATLFADDDLAHDVFCLTFDSLGRVVVSGEGYVKVLIDSNGDGKADSAKQFANGPATGAQGMYFLGRDLLCIGDEGLLRYRDKNGDDQADGKPDVFLKLKTGNEHHVHSIQKGPDGWWYIMAGNDAAIDHRYASLPTSPVKYPQNGVFFRMKPDLSGAELLTHGLRNAYDFTFNSLGDAFTFDSDDERDISLPWYRPTRVLHLLSAGHAGWVTKSWKQPDYFVDSVPVLAEFGRGSPTGVVSYRHTQFPEKYRDSLFMLDWTYGRILNVKLERSLASYHGEPETFITGSGGFGFAPTDAEVGPDGSLYVSVGGRGTRGGVYKISAKKRKVDAWPGDVTTTKAKLTACLNAPQPLTSWARKNWEPLAHTLGKQAFVDVVRNETQAINERVRAIEILTDLFGGLDIADVERCQQDDSPSVRARAVWSLQRTKPIGDHVELLTKFLSDDDPYVSRIAAETLLVSGKTFEGDAIVAALTRRLKSESGFDRMAAARLIPMLTADSFKQLSVNASKAGFQPSLTNAFGYLGRKPGVSTYSFRIGTLVLSKSQSVDEKLQAIRLMQMGLGDLVPATTSPPAFDGYAPRADLTAHERDLDPFLVELADRFPSGNDRVDTELSRLLAMLKPFNPDLLNKVLAKITDESHPTDDIHYLLVAARIPASREARHTEAVAKALVDIEPKLKRHKLAVDSSWDDRFGEIYKAHVEQDVDLPRSIVKQANFGYPGHVLFMSQVPGDLLETAIDAFARQIAAEKNYVWSNDVVFVMGESQKPEHRALLHSQAENFGVRSALFQVLATKPDATDRDLFIEGLDASQMEALNACLEALEKLPASKAAAEQVALLRCLRRLGPDKTEYAARERVVKLLQRNLQAEVPFEFGEAGYQPQTSAIEQWTKLVSQQFPTEYSAAMGSSSGELGGLKELLSKVDWKQGDIERGRKLFETRSCVQCHGNRKALGPDLTGVAGRFTREDLFIAIVLPNRDVSPRYQTTLIETKAGKVYTGLIVYESVDGLLLRNATNQTFRIESTDIEQRRKLPQSLMPAGLLKGLAPTDLADMYAYLKSLDGKK